MTAKKQTPSGKASTNTRTAAKWTKALQSKFLSVLARTGNVSEAARAINRSRRHVYDRRSIDPGFARDWKMAMDEALDDLEAALRDRAINGTAKDAGKGGFADSAGLYILKSRRGEQLGEEDEAETASPRDELMARLATMGADRDDAE